MDALTVEQFKTALPANVRKSVNQELINKMNAVLSDPDMQEVYRENLLSYTQVMKEGRFKLTNYIDAVKYVSQRLMDKTMKDAFTATFPHKIQEWTMRGVVDKDQASYITAYNKSKLVNLILEQTLTPHWILNQDIYQKALNVQAELMVTASSELVRTQAANSVLQHLKRPETHKVELDITAKEDSSIAALREATMALAAKQREMVMSGSMNAQEVAHSKITYDNDSGNPV